MLSHQPAMGAMRTQAAAVRALGSIDDPAALARWSPAVRRNTVLMDLFQELRYGPAGTCGFRVEAGLAPLAELHLVPSGTDEAGVQPLWAQVLAAQLTAVEAQLQRRTPRMAEVLAQQNGGMAFLVGPACLQPAQHGPVLELLDLTAGLASLVSQRFKHALHVQRPATLSAAVVPLLPTPEHGALPSGHGTETYAMAHVLGHLMPHMAPQFIATAHRVAENRTVAGVHYPMDNEAGRALGLSVAEYLVHRCTGTSGGAPGLQAGPWNSRVYTARANATFTEPDAAAAVVSPSGQGAFATAHPMAAWYWDRATTCLA